MARARNARGVARATARRFSRQSIRYTDEMFVAR